MVFFPVLVSTVGVGITFTRADAARHRADQRRRSALVGITGPDWLDDPQHRAALGRPGRRLEGRRAWPRSSTSPASLSIPRDYYEAVDVDGGGAWHTFRHITLPLARPATVTVIILSLIGGLRSFDLIWTMTRGGPGFTSDVIASVIYKQYQAGFYGLSTAGNVVLFILVAAIVVPLDLVPQPQGGRA